MLSKIRSMRKSENSSVVQYSVTEKQQKETHEVTFLIPQLPQKRIREELNLVHDVVNQVKQLFDQRDMSNQVIQKQILDKGTSYMIRKLLSY